MEMTKLSVELSDQLSKTIKMCIAKLQVIAHISLSDSDFHQQDNKTFCHTLIDKQTFQLCCNVQGYRNRVKLQENLRDLLEIFTHF
jgi:hypothetical protein